MKPTPLYPLTPPDYARQERDKRRVRQRQQQEAWFWNLVMRPIGGRTSTPR